MSKYTKDEQTEIVQLAMELEAAITSEQQELTNLAQMEFKRKPIAPQKRKQQPIKKVTPNYPEIPKLEYSKSEFLKDAINENKSLFVWLSCFIESHLGLCWLVIIAFVASAFLFSDLALVFIMLLIAFFILIGFAISKFDIKKEYEKACKKKQEELEQNPDYLAARAEAERVANEENRRREEEYRLQQEENRREYTQSMEQYNNVTLVAYRSELEHWQEVQAQKAELLKADIAENRLTLETLYSETQLIPKTVRSLEDLTYLYEDMSSSEHDIERAIDMLNAYKQRKLTREEAEKTRQKMDAKMDELRGNMQQGFAQVYGLIDEGNYRTEILTAQLASQMNDIRSGIRRGNIAAIVQRYGTNKRLREISNNIKS